MALKVLDHLSDCYTWESGQELSKIIRAAFEKHERIAISFDGVRDVPSSFVNAAFISLLDTYPYDFIRSHLTIADGTKQIADMIKRRFAFELNRAA